MELHDDRTVTEPAGLPELSGTVLHLPERHLLEERQNATGAEHAETDRILLGYLVEAFWIERLAVSPRRPNEAFVPKSSLAVQHLISRANL